jgi:hypothetical protein
VARSINWRVDGIATGRPKLIGMKFLFKFQFPVTPSAPRRIYERPLFDGFLMHFYFFLFSLFITRPHAHIHTRPLSLSLTLSLSLSPSICLIPLSLNSLFIFLRSFLALPQNLMKMPVHFLLDIIDDKNKIIPMEMQEFCVKIAFDSQYCKQYAIIKIFFKLLMFL